MITHVLEKANGSGVVVPGSRSEVGSWILYFISEDRQKVKQNRPLGNS